MYKPTYFLVMALLPAAASAQVWTHAASSCTPDEGSATKVIFSSGRAQFRTGETGDIYLRCNVTNPRDNGQNPNWSVLQAGYFNEPNAYVQAHLKRVDNSGATYTIATVDGLTLPAASGELRSASFSHFFNFFANAYYVELRLRRTAPDQTVWVCLTRLSYPGP
jgi:hypothetical protein